MSVRSAIPVLGHNRELLYYAPISRVDEMIESGRVRPLGTKARTRALIAADRNATLGLRLDRPQRIPPDTHNHETDDNPRGVWTFRKLYATQAAAA